MVPITISEKMMFNLGYYIKSAELNEFKEYIKTVIKKG